ncbi:unnamed protein product [Calicophoron daubneyi]|uniref:Aspartate aminotransferase n=1 Tax=Calicophoron daubneyi TaxID=300641 RepID=A0AAV2TX62_CALDB
MTDFFRTVEQAPPIEIFALSEACKNDSNPKKVNLTVGAYRTDDGEPWVLPCVRSVEVTMASDNTLNKEYLPITGLDCMCEAAVKLLLGEDNPLISSKKADGCQTLGGTGAVYLAMQFMRQVAKCRVAYVSHPTWPNHKGIANFVGFELREYKYWSPADRNVDFSGMKNDLQNAPEGSVFVLHACAHNPTGMDLNHEQWKEVAGIMKERKLFPLFDLAYQGFATGDLDNDAWAVRYFASQGMEMFVAQSFSKNFGLYNERVGNLTFITHDPVYTAHVKSQLKILVRRSWSNPPQHGGRIVATILNNPTLCAEWKQNIITMADRVKLMRKTLYESLMALKTPGSWEHIVKQIGMFSYTGLTDFWLQTETKWRVYL